jgi:hypothetical protein
MAGKAPASSFLSSRFLFLPPNGHPVTHEAQRLHEQSEETPAEAFPAALCHDSRSEATTACLYRALISP